MRLALTYNLKKEDKNKPEDYFSEWDSQETINAIASAIMAKGHEIYGVDVDEQKLISFFSKNRVDMVFNIAEGRSGRFREAHVPAILDYLKIPYTGSSAFSLALALNKALTKKILIAENIPTPNFQLFTEPDQKLEEGLRFPLIVKPNCEGSAKGIERASVVQTIGQLRDKVGQVIAIYRQEALVEEFISGRELTVGILENGRTTILPVLEIDFSGCQDSGEYFYSWKMKEFQGNKDMGLIPTFHCPARLDRHTEGKIKEVALRTHNAISCFDISRTDIRLGNDGIPYVLEINPLPGLNPRESNFPLMAYAAGLSYGDLIEAIIQNASERNNLN